MDENLTKLTRNNRLNYGFGIAIFGLMDYRTENESNYG